MSATITSGDPPAQGGALTHLPVEGERTAAMPIWTFAALVYATLLPQEVRVVVAEQVIYAPRLVALALLPWVAASILRGRLRFALADGLLLAGAGWMVVSYVANLGLGSGLLSGGALALDTAMAYLIARLSIGNLTDLRRLLVYIAPGIVTATALIVMEVALQRQVVEPFFADLFGNRASFDYGVAGLEGNREPPRRFGLIRAVGLFPHSILAGLYLSGACVLYLSSGLRGWPLWGALAAGPAALFSLSSAALFNLMIGVGLVVTDRLQRLTQLFGWPKIIAAFTTVSVAIHVGADNGLAGVIQRISLNPQTARFRRMIWHYGVQSVENNPLFGIGKEHYQRERWMVASIDNHWLMLAVRHGLITALAIFGAALLAVWGVARLASASNVEIDRRFLVGLAIVIFTYGLSGFTVAFFGGMLPWFYGLVGAGVALGMARPAQVMVAAPPSSTLAKPAGAAG